MSEIDPLLALLEDAGLTLDSVLPLGHGLEKRVRDMTKAEFALAWAHLKHERDVGEIAIGMLESIEAELEP